MNPDMLELTYIGDKIEILRRSHILSENEFESALDLKELRNPITHNHDYVRGGDDLGILLGRIAAIPPLIKRLRFRDCADR